jgi:hypothetical protein
MSAAFTAIDAGTHLGNVLIQILGNTIEPASSGAFLSPPAQVASLRIEPVGHVTVSANPNLASSNVLIFVNCSNLTIDGFNTATNSLTISSFSAPSLFGPSAQSAIQIVGGNFNTIQNCTLLGTSTFVYNSFANTTTQVGQALLFRVSTILRFQAVNWAKRAGTRLCLGLTGMGPM